MGKKAYKGFDEENGKIKCRGMEFRVGEVAEVEGEPILCQQGIHFCWNLNDINEHYTLRDHVICEVEILGDIVNQNDMKKSCTNKLQVVKMLTREEVLKISNSGLENTGYINIGDRNAGNGNVGNWNVGSWNAGNRNTGDRNAGDWNVGDRNTGNGNVGNRNTGDRNAGNGNVGNWNVGDRNTGNGNVGDRNTGNGNVGSWNTCNYSTGFFNTTELNVNIFNFRSNLTHDKFTNSKYYKALTSAQFILTEWIEYTTKDKEEDKSKELIGGHLVQYDYKTAWSKFWDLLTEEAKQTIQEIPNFNADVFYEITGVRVR